MAITERAILEDRWECFTNLREIGDEWSKPMTKLDRLIIQFIEAITREEYTGDITASAEHLGRDGSGDVQTDIHNAFRTALLDGVEKVQAAREMYPKPLAVAS